MSKLLQNRSSSSFDQSPINVELQKQFLRNLFTTLSAISGALAIIGGPIILLTTEAQQTSLLLLAILVGVSAYFGLLAFFSNVLPAQVQFLIALIGLYLYATINLVQTGLAGQYLLIIVLILVMTAATQNAVLTSVIVGLTGIYTIVCTIGVEQGWISVVAQASPSWVGSGFRYLGTAGILYFLTTYTLNFLLSQLSEVQTIRDTIRQENQDLSQTVQQRTDQLARSLQVGRTMSQLLDKTLLNRELLFQVEQIFEADSVSLYPIRHEQRNPSDSIILSTAKNRAITMSHNKKRLGVPVLNIGEGKNSVTHVLVVDRQLKPFNEQEKQLLLNLTRQFHFSLQNIQLYQQLQQRLTNQIIFNRVREKMDQAPNVRMLLNTSAQELGKLYDADTLGIEIDRQSLKKVIEGKPKEEDHV